SRVKRLGCARRLFSSCYLPLFGGSEASETGASWSPFPLLFRYVAGKSTSARLYSASCFSPVFTGNAQWRALRHVTRRVLGVLPLPTRGRVESNSRLALVATEGMLACDISASLASRSACCSSPRRRRRRRAAIRRRPNS